LTGLDGSFALTQTRFHLVAPRAVAERIYARLEQAFEDDGLPLSIFETEPDGETYEVSLYANDDAEAVAGRMRDVLSDFEPPPVIEREPLPDIDWVTHSLEGLSPVRAGRFYVHGAHGRGGAQPGEIPIEIEASLAFGTGHHGTTAGCLEMIERVLKRERPHNALDLGTGSGVLAIGLALLARIPVLATDIDPVAVRIAQENARLNHTARWVETRTALGFHHPVFAKRGPFDLITANILARPLMQLAPDMARHLAPGGSLILSGIIEEQRNAVLAAYVTQRFRHLATLRRDGWVTLHLKR